LVALEVKVVVVVVVVGGGGVAVRRRFQYRFYVSFEFSFDAYDNLAGKIVESLCFA
jgi:hypothetical protein